MKRMLLTALLIVTASLANAEAPPTAYELITKGEILDKQYDAKSGTLDFFIAWDKTKDIYSCVLRRSSLNNTNTSLANCAIHKQKTSIRNFN